MSSTTTASFPRGRLPAAPGCGLRGATFPKPKIASLSLPTPGCLIADFADARPGRPGTAEALSRAGRALPVIFLAGQGDIPNQCVPCGKGRRTSSAKRTPKEALLEAVNGALSPAARRACSASCAPASMPSRRASATCCATSFRDGRTEQIAADLNINSDSEAAPHRHHHQARRCSRVARGSHSSSRRRARSRNRASSRCRTVAT